MIGLLLLLLWLVIALRSAAAADRLWLLVGALGLLVASLFVPLLLVFPVGFFLVVTLGAAGLPDSAAEPLAG
jgi:hypothetical protein